MKVRIEDATAAQIRAFVRAQWAIPTAPNATVKSLRNKLVALEFHDEEFDLYDTDLLALENDGPETETTTEQAVRTLVAAGWSETQARSQLNLVEAQRTATRLRPPSRARGEKPYGPGKENDYFTIHVAVGSEDDGAHDAMLQVNGRRKDVPRGVDWPVNSVYLECLDHAERKVYEEVFIRDDLPRRYVPRLVLKYPYHIVDGPYDHNGFLERAKEAQAEMHARLMPAGTDVSAAQAMLQDLSAV